MQNAKAQLKRYRAAVLKSAVEGELTREWREAHQGKNELGGLEDKELYGLPGGWKWIRLGDVTGVVVGYVGPISDDYTNEQDGVLLLSTTNISDKGLNLEKRKYITKQFHSRNKKSQAQGGDIIVARHGISGLSAVLPDSISETHILNAVIIRKSSYFYSNYLRYYLNSLALSGGITKSQTGSVQKIINTSVVKNLQVPMPSVIEQQRIVEKVERRLSVADEIEKELDGALVRAERLRGSVLKSAFEGRLV